MFTGLVQAVGEVTWREEGRLLVQPPLDWSVTDWELGESIAVNGVCLTLISVENGLQFDLSQETLERTNLAQLGPGSLTNLERAIRAGDRFGGHMVQGHVDRTGTLLEVSEINDSWTFRFDVGADADRYLIDKGSICLDGISLTVIEPNDGLFDVAVIPHTFRHTNLSASKPGDTVNVEFDVLAKYVERMISLRERP